MLKSLISKGLTVPHRGENRYNAIFRSFYRRLRLIVRHLLPFLKAIAALIAIAKSLGFL